jgi:hypothetical protein
MTVVKQTIALIVTLMVMLWCLTCGSAAHAFEWEDLASHTGAAKLLDGDGGVEILSWPLCEADFDTQILDDRKLWLDVLEPTSKLGGGLSLDIVTGQPAAFGLGYRDGWTGYFAGHWEVNW